MQSAISRLSLAAATSYPSLAGYARWSNSAVSDEALESRRLAAEVVNFSERSQALFGVKAAAISDLLLLAKECCADDWDGAGSLAISTLGLRKAEEFIRALPEDLAMPELTVDPDGEISLDWISSKSRFFSLSIGRSYRFAYTWLDGSDKGHAVATFDGITIPKRIISELTDIVGYAPITFRAA